jgi:hypothetical protein
MQLLTPEAFGSIVCALMCATSADFVPARGEAGMWEDNRYFWVVLCKNRLFHIRETLSVNYRERIPLGETDAVAPRPIVNCIFNVRCDKCGKEYSYKSSDVLKFELDPAPESFSPHPLFREGDTQSVVTAQSPASISAKANTDSLQRSLLERIRSKAVPSLRIRHKESPVPHWRRPPQQK